MAEQQEQNQQLTKSGIKKGVSIQIMFPCESDIIALGYKKAIDSIIKDIPDKRCTFSISEV